MSENVSIWKNMLCAQLFVPKFPTNNATYVVLCSSKYQQTLLSRPLTTKLDSPHILTFFYKFMMFSRCNYI